MKPLSICNYYRNNKKKFISSILSVFIAVSFLYVLNTFVKSMYDSSYKLGVIQYKYYSTVKGYNKGNPIPEDIINKLNDDINVDKLIPFMKYGLRYSTPGSLNQADVFALRNKDINYFLSKQNTTVTSGRLPSENKHEIAVNYPVAQNKKIKIGDSVGNEVNKFEELNGKYKVVGILKGETMMSIVSANNETFPTKDSGEDIMRNGIMIFPKMGKASEVNKIIESLPRDEVQSETINSVSKQFTDQMGALRILDIVSILAIVLMVITVGSSKYVQFFNRKEELGILNAIGYDKSYILKRAILEVVIVNSISYIIGILLGIALSYMNKMNIFEAAGAVGVVLYSKAFIVSLYVPLFTILFTIIPINIMINKLDPIKMIENN
ncbi:ABC transporter permease [Clostridium pasteurianum]|uniref:ABC-type transport system, involved in lipoprotein release, permease component n=1 Tax=Clostridium pasteurianum BC1 TaxID=86416 RepID=R4KC36_CLOPA|nr:FtsX-like permease family protein [Clostridium pasteurianum]AGK98079.1 ABC-type transport system, involved in lipoprotein release, permease component [Clostridium pasteurianum BC1]